MLGTLEVEVNSKFPNMPLEPMFAYVGSASSVRIRNVPKNIGNWQINNVYFNVRYPDDSVKSATCVLTGDTWTGTVEGCQTSGKSEKGYTIYARGVDENGNQVSDPYVLGKGDVEILNNDGTITPGEQVQYVHLLSGQSSDPKEGDLYPDEDGYVIWQNGQANSLGTPFEQIEEYVEGQMATKQDKLTAAQISALNSAVGRRETVVTYTNGETATFDIEGELTNSSITDVFNAATVKIGSGVTDIGDSAFEDCSSLTSVTIPDSVTDIGDSAFYKCNITSLTIPDSVMTIGENAFSQCIFLTDVTVGSGVTSLGIRENAFAYCDQLTSVTFKGKSLDEVQVMNNYPWGIDETSVITTRNAASQEWVESQNYLTRQDVEPTTVYGETGYAVKSYRTVQVRPINVDTSSNKISDSSAFYGELASNAQTGELELNMFGEIDGNFPWVLSELFGTQYSPTVKLNWSIASIYRQRGSRWSIVRNKEQMWVAPGQFAITTDASGNPDGNFYVLHYGDETHPNAINDPETDVHQITVESGQGTAIYVATIDGQTGQITCTSHEGQVPLSKRVLAYRDQLSSYYTKSEIDNMIGDINTVLDNINGEVI